MSEINSVNQYYNLYDSTKGYTELLFRAGKVLQSKELNEMQSMLKNQIKNVGDTILTNGDIIEGCQLVIDGTNVTITRGKIYLNGNVHSVPDTQLEIEAEGTEIIGAILSSEIITPDDDEDLNEVASGYDNYNQDGAYRLKEHVIITLNDNNASILYTLVNGQQMAVNTAEDLTQLDKMNATLARRTFDESGNYKVSGLKLVDKNYCDDNKVYISVEPGKAYVKGYEVSKPNATTIGLDRSATLRQVSNEPKTYRTDVERYSLNNEYVKSINKIVAIVETSQSITRGSIIGGIDYLPLSPVVEVLEVTQGGTTFSIGSDFQLVNDGIDWSIGAQAPAPGSTYTVKWTYNKTMKKDDDYVLYNDPTSNIGYVEFLSDGDKPVNGSTFLVNYSFMLCRRDIIAIDKNGSVIVTNGQPDILRTVESPAVSSEEVLVLGSTLLKPNSDHPSIINNNTQTITMLDLYQMLERINALEYNQAISDLDTEAAENENATELIGVFTDGFIGMSKADSYHSEWSASIDLDNQEVTLPFETSINPLSPNKTDNFNAGLFNRLLTAPYTEINLFSQSLATGTIRINNYNAFPKRPSVKLSPEVDNWIDEQTITIQGGTKTTVITLRRWWYHKNESWAQAEKALWQSYGFADGGEGLAWNNGTSSIQFVANSVLDTAILYMRQKPVDVTVENLTPHCDNITATFDGIQVELLPKSVSYQGTTEGTLKADGNGVALGYFNIPANTLCGTRELKVYPVNTPSINGSADYTANGRLKVTTRTVFTQKTTVVATDPIAQSFQFDMDQYLTGVGVYFLDKDTVEPITIQVRNMINGYPGNTVYAEKVILPSEITISTNASIETRVEFDDPVYCNAGEQYCFTVLSNSDVDSLWMAETTKTDIISNNQVAKNPYLNGTLFSSSNALTWTAHQSSDLKFNLYGARFESAGSVIFDSIDEVSFDRLMIMSEESIPSGCSVFWQYQINDGDWMPIESYDDREISEVANNIKVKASIVANSYTSPAIALDSLILVGFENKNLGTYISKNVSIADGYNHVKIIVDLHIPANTNANVYFATDISGEDWISLDNTKTEQKSAEYKTFTFEKDLDEKAYDYRCKVVLTSTSQTSRPKAQNLRSIMKNI